MIDILNRLYPSYRREQPVEDTKKWAEGVRHVSKYIFARQYGLNTPFSSTVTKGSAAGGAGYDYLDREVELKVRHFFLVEMICD